MSSLYALTRPQALANVRLDLSDTDAANYRWTDAGLDRALDRAVERYSWVNPLMQAAQVPATPGYTIYGTPAGTFYVDRVEYPLGRWPKRFVPFLERKSPLIPAPDLPAPAPSVSFTAGGNLGAGAYRWAVTFTVPGPPDQPPGETPPSPIWTATSPGAGQAATIQGIPTGPYGVTGRNIYRSAAGGSGLQLAGSIPDNLTTIFVDTIADAQLATPTPAANTTANLDQVELQIPPNLWPADSTSILEITYAAKHQLDGTGTTIPERHWHCLLLGALAYAMWSYLPQVNDNFQYADGHLHDRVDDTASTIAWQTQCRQAMDDFEKQLALVKEESNAGITGMTHWGDVPVQWGRL